MNHRWSIVTTVVFTAATLALHASPPLEPLHARCTISEAEHRGKLRLEVGKGDCDGRHCGSNFDEDSLNRLTGVTVAELSNEGARLTATLRAEAGTFACSGSVHERELRGDSSFTPDSGFVSRLEEMGFSGLDSEKLEAYAFVNVETAWVRSLKQAGVLGMTTDNLIALRIFNVEESYIHAITALGYPMPSADMLIALRVQGVDPAEVGEIRALGFQPTLDELIQIRIFHITPEFIRRMRARDLKDLTIAKLVQIRIFKIAE